MKMTGIALRYGSGIKQHKTFIHGQRMWQRFANCLGNEEISVRFLGLVEKFENELSLLLPYLNTHDRQAYENACKQNMKMIKNLIEKVKTIRGKLSRLELAIMFGKNVTRNCAEIPRNLIALKENLNTKLLKELNDEFWGPLLPLLDLAAQLEPLMDSVSFRNVSQVCLSEKIELIKCVENETNKLHSLFKFLTTHAIPRFKAELVKMCEDPESQTFETMKNLRGLKSESDLRKEPSIVESYFKTQLIPLNLKQYMEDFVNYEKVVQQVADVMHVLDTFELQSPDNNLVKILTQFAKDFSYEPSINLKCLHEPMVSVQGILSKYVNENSCDVLMVLGKSRELLEFLKEIANEDIRVLIDAVEEHSDEFVSESLVSELIHVHGFLVPVIKTCQEISSAHLPEELLSKLHGQCKVLKNMAVKIDQCNQHVHSLKQLYYSVANRGEVTKDVINNCLKNGKVNVSLDQDGTCKIHMLYAKKDNSEATYSLSDLRDLRSRAHLIVSSKRSQRPTPIDDECVDSSVHFEDFVEQVNILSDIEDLILKLRLSGFIKYQTIDQVTITGTQELRHLKQKLFHELEEWEECLGEARQQYFFFNYFWYDHLCLLYNSLTNTNFLEENFKDVLTLIHFVDPTIEEQRLREYYKTMSLNNPISSQSTSKEVVSTIGNALTEIFENTRPSLRNIADDTTSSFSQIECRASVTQGEPFVAVLEEQSPLTVNVMLALYENTTNGYPEPYQVIFCGPETAWEEIHLFLQRCFTQSSNLSQQSLFCLANVELLRNEVQFQLVDFIKKKEDHSDYHLAIICRGGDHHHIAEEFSKCRHSIAGMLYSEISERLTSAWPDVRFVTSTLPGLGKTEFIRQEVFEKDMNVVTFPISGQFDQKKIIHSLRKLDLKEFQCLHFDIGEVDNPFLLDTFLFQLIVTGMVSCGTQFYKLYNTHVFIEIANSLNDQLRQSLVIPQCFNCVNLKWNDYNDLKVSSKITSDIQVVCQYLDVFDRQRLESTDIHFSGEQKTKALPAERCRSLLRKYYSTTADTKTTHTTFTALNTFLGLLADQLRKFSKSSFFKTAHIKYMVRKRGSGVRENLFVALVNVSKEFAAWAMQTSSSRTFSPVAHFEVDSAQEMDSTAEHMIKRVEKMIHWEQSNHLVIAFHGINSQSITAVYRKKDDVPPQISNLLRNQIVKEESKELDDFESMSPEKLDEKLEKVARTKPRNNETEEKGCHEKKISGYVLTPDNMLKMILIILRVRAHVPVIIMGETGCGKTSLVKYLANTCDITLYPFNFHAGRTEEEIKHFVQEKDKTAQKTADSIWVFFDEINTCDHLGLINEILCHHTMSGQPLSSNLIFLAACNPYKKRPKDRIVTAGLEREDMADEYSQLVYRVHPLPEAMVDYVWDYGSLTPEDEKKCIERMVPNLFGDYKTVLVDLLAESQKFIRESENNPFCVSLRDVHRCIILLEWFVEMIKKRAEVMNAEKKNDRNGCKMQEHLKKYKKLAKKYDDNLLIKSSILALAHCYVSRLETDELRSNYRERMAQVFESSSTAVTSEDFSAIIRMEQEDYLGRMELPVGTARNSALRENVFVMLVSILNRIPVFVVGKPGCSKSLSIQLIRSNLRGKDSRDPFFKTLPQLYVVSYQGSESSTSEGINKVFEIASKYKEHNKGSNVLPVVLLDEVGLAEDSPNNPLKVLHSLLEPEKGKLPDVAVVGISNWALDAAKMNRAIHLSRPEPTVKDLEETATSLFYAESKLLAEIHTNSSGVLNCLANAYHGYQSKQGRANFHGLRDYYSLIKSLDAGSSNDISQICVAVKRNFGGIREESSKVQETFIDKLKSFLPGSDEDITIPVTTLIHKNLADPKARHLMLITNGDSAVGILKQILLGEGETEKETITIFGSRFEEDLSDDYNYRMLSRIILCMERDCVLVLRDLECIYGSLYDMLNQNYAVVGKRKNCRVALGAYSNPMCYVNDGFRCIVLVDYDKVDYSDPPFLNRFEKQLLRFSDVLDEKQKEIITQLKLWVSQMSSVEGLTEQFKESDMFVGFHEDTLPSLVLLHSNDTDVEANDIMLRCKDDLMLIATPDGVLRAQKCERIKEFSGEVEMLSEKYFAEPIHNGLASYISNVVQNQGFSSSMRGEAVIVMTYATVHTNINKCLDATTIKYQVERLGAYKSEKQLEDRIHNSFSSDKELLVLQCKPELDGGHMILARSIIEDQRNSYKVDNQGSSVLKQKHVFILVHVNRADKEETGRWQFNFLSGWKQVFLDVIEEPCVPMNEIHTTTVDELLSQSTWSLQKFSKDSSCLLWCFKCIKYINQPRSLDSILDIANRLFESKKVYNVIEKLVMKYISANSADDKSKLWPVKVACNKESLINSSTFSSTVENYLFCQVREPLAKIIYFLEQENAWPLHLLTTNENVDIFSDYEDVWCELITKDTILNVSKIPAPLGTESYTVDGARLKLNVPFSQVIIRKVNVIKEQALRKRDLHMDDSEGEERNQTSKSKQMPKCTEIVKTLVPDILDLPEHYLDLYADDLLDVTLAYFSGNITRQERIDIGNCTFLSFANYVGLSIKDSLQRCVQLHFFLWTSEQQIIDQIRMYDSCVHFVNPPVVKNHVRKFLRKCLSAINSSHSENNFSESDKLVATDAPAMTVNLESEFSEKAIPCLKRKRNELHQAENYDQDDVATKRSKKEVNLKSEVTEHVFCDSKNATNELDSKVDDGESNSETKENRSESSEESDDEESESDKSDCESSASEDESNIGVRSSDKNEIFENGFEDFMVTTFCEEMILSESAVARNGGLESWIRNSSLLLSLAFNVSNESSAFHFLRLCVDFAKMVVRLRVPVNINLYLLDEIAKELKPHYLNTNGSLQKLTERLIDPLKKHVENGEEDFVVIQKFLATFYIRCIDTYEDPRAAAPIMKNVLSIDTEDSTLLMKPIMYSLLQACGSQLPGIFFNIIIDRNAINNCVILKEFDEEFKRCFKRRLIHHDSYPAVLICDAIYLFLKRDPRFDFKQLTGPDCELLKCLRCATNVFNGGDDDIGLVLLLSVAFLRVFYSILSKHPGLFTRETSHTPIMDEINSLLDLGTNRRSSTLQQFLLKQVYGSDMSFYNIHKLRQESEKLPVIKSSYPPNKIVNKAELVFVYRLQEYKEVSEAFRKLMIQSEEDMLNILRKCQHYANHRLALLGILINKFYVKKALGNLTDTEERLAKWFSDKSSLLPFPLKALIVRITGCKTFSHSFLQISLESSVDEIQTSLLILYNACVLASCVEGDKCPLFQNFPNPTTCHSTCPPVFDKGRLFGVFDKFNLSSQPLSATCCDGRMRLKTNSQQMKCPFCHGPISNFDDSFVSSNKKYFIQRGPENWHKRTENMDIFAFRCLHLIVNACFYAGIATGISSKEVVAPLLHSDQQGSPSGTACEVRQTFT